MEFWEASGCLVALAVFKTDVTEYLGQAGSIPVRLRCQSADRFAGVSSNRVQLARPLSTWPYALWDTPEAEQLREAGGPAATKCGTCSSRTKPPPT